MMTILIFIFYVGLDYCEDYVCFLREKCCNGFEGVLSFVSEPLHRGAGIVVFPLVYDRSKIYELHSGLHFSGCMILLGALGSLLWTIIDDLFLAGISLLVRGPCTGGCMVNFRSRYKLIENHVANARTHCCGRSFASEASKKLSETSSAVWL